MLSLAAHQNWHILATDCTQAFGNAKPLDVHYVRLPRGFSDRPYNGALARLMQNLYGLNTAPYAWFTLFTNYMISIASASVPVLVLIPAAGFNSQGCAGFNSELLELKPAQPSG